MREKLNNSPIAQVAIVAVLVVAAGFVFLSKSGGGEEEGGESSSGEVVATVNGATATGATPGEAVESAVQNLEGGGGEATGTALPTSVPGPAPPPAFTAAYESGKVVVLLVVRDGGIDDAFTAAAVAQLRRVHGVAVFAVRARHISRYAAVTVGLDLNRVPALVVMRPRGLSGGVPQATVDYGFQTPQSAVQAVVDAVYRGPEATYHPE